MSAVTVAAAAATLTALSLSCATSSDVSSVSDVSETAAEVAPAASALSPRGGLAWRDYFPNVELITHNGDPVRFYDDLIKGKVVLINFMYASCTES